MARHTIIQINSEVNIVTGETPIIYVNKIPYYVLNDNLLTAIKNQINASVQGASAYEVVGYIDNGKVSINDKKATVTFDIYDYRKYMWEDL